MKLWIYIFCLWSTVSVFSETKIVIVKENVPAIGEFEPFPSMVLSPATEDEPENSETTED